MAIGANITTTTAAKFIPDVWSDGVLEAVEFATTIADRVTRDYEGVIDKMGATVHVPRLSNLTTQTKTAGTQISFEAITETEMTISIATHEYAAFLIENIVEVQNKYDTMLLYQRKIGYALARGRDVNLATNRINSFATNVIGTLGVEMAAEDYLSIWQKLAEAGLLEQNPDPSEDFSLFLSPAAYAVAMKTDIFINRQYNPEGNAIQKAYVGDIYGLPVYISNLLQSPAAGQHRCSAFHRGAAALAVQETVPVRSDWLIRDLGDGVVGWDLYGSAILSYPPETPGGGTAVDNRGVLVNTV